MGEKAIVIVNKARFKSLIIDDKSVIVRRRASAR